MSMQHGHTAWTSTFDMQQGHTVWTCSMDMKHEHAARTCKDKHHGHAVWTCSVEMQNETQPGQEVWTLSMGMQQGHTTYLVRKSANLSLVRYLADDRLAELIRGTSASAGCRGQICAIGFSYLSYILQRHTYIVTLIVVATTRYTHVL
jgi:hypothetical protein